jgi:hypothetical protein
VALKFWSFSFVLDTAIAPVFLLPLVLIVFPGYSVCIDCFSSVFCWMFLSKNLYTCLESIIAFVVLYFI